MAAKVHKVKQGDSSAKIAKKYGFSNWRTVYDHEDNAELNQKRGDPNILYPGDTVAIPEKTAKEESSGTGQRHRFRYRGEKLWLRLILRDFDEQPLAETAYELDIGDQAFEGMTDGEGFLEHGVPAGADIGILNIDGLTLRFTIGYLDPIEEVEGWQARLYNLGYYSGPIDGSIHDEDGEERPQLRWAVESFQLKNKLDVNGKMDEETKEKLKEIYGC